MNLKKMLKRLKSDERINGRRRNRHSDPANGLEYNKINTAHAVCGDIWQVDIARTPQVIKEIGIYVNVNGEAWLANKDNHMINYRAHKVYGRGRF